MIAELVERKKGKFDHIVIETTGNLISLNSFPQSLSQHVMVKYEFLTQRKYLFFYDLSWIRVLQNKGFHSILNFLSLLVFFSGLANPSPIIQTFYAEDKVFNDVKLDGVVTLVDAKHAGFHLDEVKPKGVVNEAVEQIAYADRIIVNKVIHIALYIRCCYYS